MTLQRMTLLIIVWAVFLLSKPGALKKKAQLHGQEGYRLIHSMQNFILRRMNCVHVTPFHFALTKGRRSKIYLRELVTEIHLTIPVRLIASKMLFFPLSWFMHA